MKRNFYLKTFVASENPFIMLSTPIRVFSIQFDIPLKFNLISKWRGAIAEHVGLEDERFHNHQGSKERFHYRYPTVCYRSKQGKAAIWSFGEGTEALKDLLLNSTGVLTMDGSPYELKVYHFDIYEFQLSMNEEMQKYRLHNWLALNEFNIKQWDLLTEEGDRKKRLEQILASNIIAFAKAVAWQLPQRLEVAISEIVRLQRSKHKGIQMLSFDIAFTANIFLPRGLGLGKSVSHGYGVLS
jgi:hypothetical protein